jgi:hypothetical protein
MTTKNRAELVEMAADELGLSSSGNSVEAEDAAKIDAKLDGLLAELELRGVASVPDLAEIPVEYCGPLSELLANENSVTFGRQRMARSDREGVEDRLKVMVQRVAPAKATMDTDHALQGHGHMTYSRWARGY